MPYSDDPRRLEEMIPYLEPIARGEDVRWPIKRGNANTVAFRIREALRIVVANKLRYPELAEYASDYKVRVVDAFTVEAIRRTPRKAQETIERLVEIPSVPIEVQVSRATVDADKEIIESAAKATSFTDRTNESLRALLGKQTPMSVTDAYRRYGKVRPTLHFPDAAMDDEELTQLFRWASHQTPPLMLMVHGAALTVSILDPMVAEFSWRPSEEALEELEEGGN
jgi:hypothetical protein